MDHTVNLQTTPYLPLLPVAEHHRPLAGTHCAYPRDGQAELLGGWLNLDKFPVYRELNPDTVTHPSTNRARRRVTLLI